MNEVKPVKPLGRKNYGSIGHLPDSRIGPGDHHVHVGQGVICCTKKRDKHDVIIVTEKLDGSNCGVAKVNGEILALGRAGYLAQTSKFEQHQLFAYWVRENVDRFDAALEEGQRIIGEWMAQAHGTRYKLPHEPFVVFDIMTADERMSWAGVIAKATLCGFTTPRVIHQRDSISVADVLALLEPSGHGALDSVEGAVWRVERKGQFDFMAKYVRPDKIDGIYLPEQSGGEAIWNWRP